jgi:C2 domain
LKSSTIASIRPTWNQKIMLPMFVPSFIKSLLMQVWDYDLGQADDPVGSVFFPIESIIRGEYREPLWVHLYGAPLKVEDKQQTNFMHQYPDKGKILDNHSHMVSGICPAFDRISRQCQGGDFWSIRSKPATGCKKWPS